MRQAEARAPGRIAGDPPAAGRVPVEWLGRARLLRDRIAASYEQFDAGIQRLLAPHRGVNRSPLSRRSLLGRLVTDWAALPEFGRLKLKSSTKGAVAIDEIRCAPTALLRAGWSDPEAAVAVVLLSIRIDEGVVTDKVRLLASVGLHALARRFERGQDRTDAAVLRDLLPLIAAWPSVVRAPGDFAIPAGVGVWRGLCGPYVLAGEAMTVVSVRTYV